MPTDNDARIRSLDRLVPAVAGYATDRFSVADDLDRLERVRRVQAPEATVLYCARILEVLAADALTAIEMASRPNVFGNLELLESLNLIPTATRHWAHALRRLGNLVRHIHRRILPEDAELGVHFLERWLEWFFHGFRYGQRLPALTRDAAPLGLSADAELHATMRLLEAEDADLGAAARQMDPGLGGRLPVTPTLPAVLAELLLDRGDHASAEALLRAALARFPDDLRLRQLQGLYFSRTGRLQEALAWLEPLYEEHGDDGETAGITAGAYKRAWFEVRSRQDWLESSHRAYRQAWKKSKQSNGYLGINAATTSLWLGRPAESCKIAETVSELLRSQMAALAKFSGDEDLAFNFWQHMTLAEADLLLGRLPEAQDRLRRTIERYGDRQRSNIDVAQRQFDAILSAQGLSSAATESLGSTAADPGLRRMSLPT
jgi:tetratricopeptide (TPR) repeat protein